MPSLPALVEKFKYLFISASPGGLKIFILAAIVGISSKKIQSEVANDLSIVAFLTMLTAIGAGTQILHLVPKGIDEKNKAAEVFKSYLIQLVPCILIICAALYLFDFFVFEVLAKPVEAVLLLLFSSIYWLFRHYYLARFALNHLLIMEFVVWMVTGLGIALLSYLESVTVSSVLLIAGLSYFLSLILPFCLLMRYRSFREKSIVPVAASIGLSNLVSGGVINLAPSICFHVGNPLLAGVVGLITNISSVALTIIRAFLLKQIPRISEKISGLERQGFFDLFKKSKSKIKSIVWVNFFLVQPLAIYVTWKVQPAIKASEIAIYTLLITTFICIPQFSAIESVVINFLGRSRVILFANLTHALIVICVTSMGYFYWGKSPYVFFTFLTSAAILYVFRNLIINSVVQSEIDERGLN